MHGERETSAAPRLTCTLIHLAFLGIAAWLYFAGGLAVIFSAIGHEFNQTGNLTRQVVLFSFGVVLFARMSITLYYLLKRRFGWSELGGVLFALFLYQVVLAALGAGEFKTIDNFDILGIALFILGSLLNTGSELQRKWYKNKPENKGQLYTGGLFGYARHINYFGDSLWVTGWAMLTRNIWSSTIPIFITIMFIFFFIPSLTMHLKARYGDQFDQYERKTKAFIPFIY